MARPLAIFLFLFIWMWSKYVWVLVRFFFFLQPCGRLRGRLLNERRERVFRDNKKKSNKNKIKSFALGQVLTFIALGSKPAHLAKALPLGVGGGFQIDALAVTSAVLVFAAFVPVLATVSRIERVAATASRNVFAVTRTSFAIFRTWQPISSVECEMVDFSFLIQLTYEEWCQRQRSSRTCSSCPIRKPGGWDGWCSHGIRDFLATGPDRTKRSGRLPRRRNCWSYSVGQRESNPKWASLASPAPGSCSRRGVGSPGARWHWTTSRIESMSWGSLRYILLLVKLNIQANRRLGERKEKFVRSFFFFFLFNENFNFDWQPRFGARQWFRKRCSRKRENFSFFAQPIE